MKWWLIPVILVGAPAAWLFMRLVYEILLDALMRICDWPVWRG